MYTAITTVVFGLKSSRGSPGGGDSQMKRAGMLAGKFEFNLWGMEGRGQSYSVCRAGWGKEDKHAYLHSRLSLLAKRAGFHSKKRWRWRCMF